MRYEHQWVFLDSFRNVFVGINNIRFVIIWLKTLPPYKAVVVMEAIPYTY